MSIELAIKKTVTVQAKELRIYCKVVDDFSASLVDQDGAEICSQHSDYVPSFMPGKHFGDYVILNIDMETGMVTNWKKPDPKEVAEWVAKCQREEA